MADSKKKHRFAGDICELQSLKSPPRDVCQILLALFIVLGKPLEKGREWKNCQNYLGNSQMLNWIDTFDPQTCSPEAAQKARETMKDITVEKIKRASAAAASLFVWTDAQINLVLS